MRSEEVTSQKSKKKSCIVAKGTINELNIDKLGKFIKEDWKGVGRKKLNDFLDKYHGRFLPNIEQNIFTLIPKSKNLFKKYETYLELYECIVPALKITVHIDINKLNDNEIFQSYMKVEKDLKSYLNNNLFFGMGLETISQSIIYPKYFGSLIPNNVIPMEFMDRDEVVYFLWYINKQESGKNFYKFAKNNNISIRAVSSINERLILETSLINYQNKKISLPLQQVIRWEKYLGLPCRFIIYNDIELQYIIESLIDIQCALRKFKTLFSEEYAYKDIHSLLNYYEQITKTIPLDRTKILRQQRNIFDMLEGFSNIYLSIEEEINKITLWVEDIVTIESNCFGKTKVISDLYRTNLRDFKILNRLLTTLNEKMEHARKLTLLGDIPSRSIFKSDTFDIEDKLCFVIMPFKPEYKALYLDVIKPTLKLFNYKCLIADDIFQSKSIMEDIWENINRAKFLIAVLKERNPNVFYELGLAHAIGKDVILLSTSMDDIPSDIRHLRIITFDSGPKGRKNLFSKLTNILEELSYLNRSNDSASSRNR